VKWPPVSLGTLSACQRVSFSACLLQEADEAQLWLELLRDDCAVSGEQIDHLLRETDELMAIFTSMVSKLRKSSA
jgi:four helix bundle protein